MANDNKLSNRERKKRRQRIIWGVVTFMLAVGLIGSSIAWGLGSLSGLFSPEVNEQDNNQKTVEDQIKELEKNVEKDPKDIKAHKELANAYFQSSKVDQAIEEYKKIIELDKNDMDAYVNLSMVLLLNDKNEQAVEYIEKAIAVNPDYAPAHYSYGLILGMGTKDYDNAVKELEKFIELQKTGTDVEQAQALIKELKAAKAEAEKGGDSNNSDQKASETKSDSEK